MRDVQNGLFFIVGPGRAGTTLLQSMLTSHSRITIPPETQFFEQIWPLRSRIGPLDNEVRLRKIVRLINSSAFHTSHMELDCNEILDKFLNTDRSYEALFITLLTLYGSRRSKPRIGEKSPEHIYYVPLLSELYPNAKFIFMIRDPRAVVSSERKTPWGSQSAYQIAKRWSRVLDTYKRLSLTLPPNRYKLVRYEDLILKPEESLRDVCGFLGEEYELGMLQYFQRGTEEKGYIDSETWKESTLRPLDKRRLGAWEKELTPADTEIVNRTSGLYYKELGYDIGQPHHMNRWLLSYCLGKDRLKGYLATLTGKRRVRIQKPFGAGWIVIGRRSRNE